MAFYISLVAIFLVFASIVKMGIPDRQRQERIILNVSMLALFLVFSLKHEQVGTDIIGYKEMYDLAFLQVWGDWEYVYFETGYLILSTLFSKLGLDFQVFMAVYYFLFCTAVYQLIKRYSPDVTMSILLFICYQFFVFALSAVRQTFAMSICVFAFFLWLKPKKRHKFLALLLIALAMSFHQSAVIFFVIPILTLLKPRLNILYWVAGGTLLILIRPLIWRLVSFLYDKNETDVSLGNNFILWIGISVFAVFTYLMKDYDNPELDEDTAKKDTLALRVILICLIFQVIFSGSGLLRANMFYTLFLVPFFPRFVEKYEDRFKIIINFLVGAFLIYFFYAEALAPNQLNMIPYRLFWK